MEYRGYIVFNAFQIAGLDIEALEARLVKRFEELDTEGKGTVTGEQTRVVFGEEAVSLLLPGVEFPVERLDNAFQAESWAELDKDAFVMVVEASLQALGEDLKAKPIVASRLDGSVIRELLADEDDFALLTQNLFTKLDVDESGKLTRRELEPALLQLNVEFGVPKSAEKPANYAETLLDELFKKHGAEGSEDLGQAQFAGLLRDMLVDLADTLAKNPVLSVHPGLDPNKWTKTEVLEEIMGDQEKVDEITESFFKGLDVNQDGRLQKEELKPMFLINSTEVPTLVADQKAMEEINNVFPEEDAEVPGEISKDDFKTWLECVLNKYVTNAKAHEE